MIEVRLDKYDSYKPNDFASQLLDPRKVVIVDAFGRSIPLIQNRSDELAAEAGHLFDAGRARHIQWVCHDKLRLWEGEFAGRPFEWLPWHYECLPAIFGWVRFSERWSRYVRRFTKAQVFIPKKNGKSPTGAAIGIYLWRYDGEEGQHVFSGARDGKQAGIIHRHATNMSKKSPDLADEIATGSVKINKSTGKIEHVPSSSTYEILAGDNAESQEGLNGCLILDEIHVVSEKLALIVEDMGASRSEPLQFLISTAGNSFEGWGRKQYEIGKDIEAGKNPDILHVYFKSYEAPQDATDAELEDPEVWKAANPSWGITIDPEEFRAAYAKARKSNSDWSAFKQRRLNIWQRTASPWLRPSDWDRCELENFRLEDFRGKQAGLGMDLSKTRDMSAAVFVIRIQGDNWVQYPIFWLPQSRADEIGDKINVHGWSKLGHLRIVPGDTQDQQVIAEDIADVCRILDVGMVAYDKTFAEELTSNLVEQLRVIRDRVEFPQTVSGYAPFSAEYEKRIIEGTLKHPGNAVLTWQAGHVLVKQYGAYKKPVKDNKDSLKSIDGIQAGIMGACALLTQPPPKRRMRRVIGV